MIRRHACLDARYDLSIEHPPQTLPSTHPNPALNPHCDGQHLAGGLMLRGSASQEAGAARGCSWCSVEGADRLLDALVVRGGQHHEDDDEEDDGSS